MDEKMSAVCLPLEQWNRILSRLLKQSLPPDTLVMVGTDPAEETVITTVFMEN